MLTAHSISSQLELRFQSREKGNTVLAERKTGGLAHVGKPHWNGHVLLTQVINPTAGFFAGDMIRSSVTLEEGARVLLSNPGATRIHTMKKRNTRAQIHQSYTIEKDASLDLYPDLSISQRGSQLEQSTTIHLASSACCCFLEILTPGRVAHGESLEWNLLSNTLEIYRENALLVKERMHLREEDKWRLLSKNGDPYHIAVFWIQHPTVSAWDVHTLLKNTDFLPLSGWTILADGLACLRIVTPSSVQLRKAVDNTRALLHTLEPCFGTSNALF